MFRTAFVCLAFLTLALAGCSGTSSTTSNTAAGDNQAVSISEFKFNPSTVNLNKGSSLTWTNEGSAKHSVSIHSPAGAQVKDDDVAPGATTSYTFNDVGSYHVFCKYHSQMVMSVTVK
jgi:plastocyanin